MIHAVMADDSREESEILAQCIARYGEETGTAISVKRYADAVKLLEEYDPETDIIFLDVEMPQIDGLKTARLIRERDKRVIIVFVTNFAQYAISGYEVNAFDYVLKPVRYSAFAMTMDRIVNILGHRRDDYAIHVRHRDGMLRLAVSDLVYLEVANHDVMLHTVQGESIKIRRPLSHFIEELVPHHFALCNACYLVNLRYVEKIDKEFAVVGKYRLQISQSKRKSFLREVAKYFGGSV